MIGVDEVGRGAWAGPLLVAAVRLNKPIEGLTDSKLLTKRKREALCPLIQANADIGFGWMSAGEIDEVGLSEAMRICALRAVTQLRTANDEPIVIDGSVNVLPGLLNVSFEPKAELTYDAVAAASIVAKVFRDNYMLALGQKIPEYHFDTHVGYGTKTHIEALQIHGTSIWHRHSYKPIKAFADAIIQI